MPVEPETFGIHTSVPRSPPPHHAVGRGQRGSSSVPWQRHRGSTPTTATALTVFPLGRSGNASRPPPTRIRTSVRPSRWDRDVGSPAASGGVGIDPGRTLASGNSDPSGLLHHPASPDLLCHSPSISSGDGLGHVAQLQTPLLG
jgi:hypothetical protein